MKKKIASKQPNESKFQQVDPFRQTTKKSAFFKKSQKSLFQINYELIAKTINDAMSQPTFLSTINKILLHQPSIQLISFQQIEKNLVLKQYLRKYHRLDRIQEKINSLISKHLPNVKANYMDFKIENFLILNKYKVTQRVNLPYPLCTKFQKLTDSKMSSTKSVSNKVLQELETQFRAKDLIKTQNPKLKQLKDSKSKKNLKTMKMNTQRFQIKILTQGIGEMIQNIKDVRALQNFKKEMEKSSQFKFRNENFQENESKLQKKPEKKQILKMPKKSFDLSEMKERQFKRKVEDEMGNFRILESKSPSAIHKIKSDLNLNLPASKGQKSSKFSFKSTQRLHTNIEQEMEEYGLSVIRERRKKSQSNQYKRSKSKSRDKSKSKQSSHKLPLNLNKRLETQHSSSSTQRLNTGHSILAKSKSSSRIPTEYDSTVILKINKSKSKSKNHDFMASSVNKIQSKSSSIASKVAMGFKKSKSKSKVNLLQFSNSNKEIKK